MTATENHIPFQSLLLWHAGALPEADRRVLAERIDGDPAARATLSEWQLQDDAITALYAPVAEEALPPRLTALLDAARAAPVRPPFTLPRISAFAGALICLAFGLGFGWGVHAYFFSGGTNPAMDAARAYRTYVVETLHPVEVPASDTQLTTWVSKRLGHDIRPPDFARAGYLLMGGRVLPAAAGAAALFMYQNAAGQRLALYVAPKGNVGPTAFRFFRADGTQGFWWLDDDLCYALAGSQPRATLRRIATMAYNQLL